MIQTTTQTIKQTIIATDAYKRWTHYTYNQKLVLMTVVAMFLPYALGAAVLLANLVRFYRNGTLSRAWKQMPMKQFLSAFLLYGGIISTLEGNLIGLLCMLGVACLFAFTAILRFEVKKELFQDCIRGAFVAFSAAIAVCMLFFLFDHSPITMGGGSWALHTQIFRDQTKFFNFWFFNANYFAMLLEFTIVVAFWAMPKFQGLQRRAIGLFLIACGIALILSGSRLGMATAAVSAIFLLYLEGRKKIAGAMVLFCVACAIDLMGSSPIITRFANLQADFGIRDAIWSRSWDALQNHWIAGVGPMGTMKLIGSIRGILVAHAHNIILDSLLNYGIIGVALFVPVVFHGWKETKKLPVGMKHLVTALTFVVVFHGMADVSIFWLQTGLLYLVVVNALPELTGVAARERRVAERRQLRLGVQRREQVQVRLTMRNRMLREERLANDALVTRKIR